MLTSSIALQIGQYMFLRDPMHSFIPADLPPLSSLILSMNLDESAWSFEGFYAVEIP